MLHNKSASTLLDVSLSAAHRAKTGVTGDKGGPAPSHAGVLAVRHELQPPDAKVGDHGRPPSARKIRPGCQRRGVGEEGNLVANISRCTGTNKLE